MDEDELEAIRRRKMVEIQQAAEQRVAEQELQSRAAAQRQLILRQILTPEARERLGRITLAYPEVSQEIENRLIALAQSGRVTKAIDDATLKEILRAVAPKKRETKIEWR